MRSLFVAVGLLLIAAVCHANPFTEQVRATLLDHVSLTALVQDGETDLALLDSVIQIGKHNGEYLLGLQAGFSGSVSPDPGAPSGAGYLVGATLRLSPLVKGKVALSPQWEFLRALEYGPSYHYDLREKESMWGLAVGLAFDPAPKQ